MYPGIADRMQKEITALAPSSMKVYRPYYVYANDRLKLSPHLNVNTVSGSVDLSLLPSLPSNKCGSPNRNMTKVVLPSFTGISSLEMMADCKGNASKRIGPVLDILVSVVLLALISFILDLVSECVVL